MKLSSQCAIVNIVKLLGHGTILGFGVSHFFGHSMAEVDNSQILVIRNLLDQKAIAVVS